MAVTAAACSKEDCKTFLPMSRIGPVSARPAPQSKLRTGPICVKTFHCSHLVTTVIHIQSVRSQTLYVCIYTCSAQYGGNGREMYI